MLRPTEASTDLPESLAPGEREPVVSVQVLRQGVGGLLNATFGRGVSSTALTLAAIALLIPTVFPAGAHQQGGIAERADPRKDGSRGMV